MARGGSWPDNLARPADGGDPDRRPNRLSYDRVPNPERRRHEGLARVDSSGLAPEPALLAMRRHPKVSQACLGPSSGDVEVPTGEPFVAGPLAGAGERAVVHELQRSDRSGVYRWVMAKLTEDAVIAWGSCSHLACRARPGHRCRPMDGRYCGWTLTHEARWKKMERALRGRKAVLLN